VAIDAATGKILWIRLLDTMALCGATVINDLVFTAEYDGTIHAFKADSGEEVFVYKAPAKINGWPAVANDTIVWPAGDGDEPSLVALRLSAAAESLPPSQNETEEDIAAINATEPAISDEAASNETVAAEASPGVWAPDGIISPGEYAKNLTLANGRYTVHWKNDAEDLYMALEGRTNGFVAIGFEPTQAMMDADMVMGWVSGGQATVLDLYSTGVYGPHPADESLGGRDDIFESGGTESGDWTVIEFRRKMDTGDQFDKSFQPGRTIDMIWSMSSSDTLSVRHDVRGTATLALE
jgi:hypothetical protein